ncbi:hypothetical protein BABINDRAFT_162228 [Babjeviella inositovora NRRL Y-12698]|uniref:Uncharacterized protein n=1 Tax=Babjeviella inositovora NRRL Y-12698 TaxID=984486 RepID=A0A1E3QNA2_9ASCO|nr:uncharacterized protein BABINDRAFT_162228 [Babjeviella inositovora NRRL Y-12698]ODQ79186.1 hypothetical protein BABINDRAFT_162228 [Babjeviella inositovora NRRL Y-12698]
MTSVSSTESSKHGAAEGLVETEVPEITTKKQFVLWRWLNGSYMPPIPTSTRRYPMLDCNWLSFLTFWWLNDIMRTGYVRQLEVNDLYSLENSDLALKESTARFEANFKTRLEQYYAKHPTNRGKIPRLVLIWALNDTFRHRFWIGGLCKLCCDVGQVLNPLLARSLIKFIENRTTPGIPHIPIKQGVGYALGMMFLLLFTSQNMNHFFHYSMLAGIQAKGVLTQVTYKKAFTLSLHARKTYTNGKVTGLVTNDLAMMERAFQYLHIIWIFPVTMGISLAILIVNLGVAALAGFGVVITLTVVTTSCTKIFTKKRKETNVFIDRRVDSIREVIGNIKMIKFYSWEMPFFHILKLIRRDELAIQLRIQFLKSIINGIVLSIPIFASMVAFLTMYSLGGALRAADVFSSISLFNVMRQPLMLLPTALNFSADAYVALQRLAEFLESDDQEEYLEYGKLGDVAMRVEGGGFVWGEESAPQDGSVCEPPELLSVDKRSGSDSASASAPVFAGLTNINLEVRRGELVVVTGLIGSGKSSLLQAITGNMDKTSGAVTLNLDPANPSSGQLIFCSYPWVQNATIKDNITFGLPLIASKYEAVVAACSLVADFEILEYGDMTEVGERGITLSGGQKARINLARAIYASDFRYKGGQSGLGHDIILLDDVLSAVDARVGRHIMDECINGVIKDKTRILATHQLSLIGSADRIVFLNGDGSIDVGTYTELAGRNSAFVSLMHYSTELNEEEGPEEAEETEKVEEVERVATDKLEHDHEDLTASPAPKFAEARQSGSIPFKVYRAYFREGSGVFGFIAVPLLVLCCSLFVFCQFFQSVWLSFWIEKKFKWMSNSTYIGLYITFCFSAFIFFCAAFSMMTYINNKASVMLFNQAARKVLQTPMAFMDTTPTGRVLNRFTKDVDTIDYDNPDMLRLLLNSSSFIFGVFIMCIIYLPWFALAVPPILFVYFSIAGYYQPQAFDVKRLESVSRSHTYGHFNETLNGLTTVKSFRGEARFMHRHEQLLEQVNSAALTSIATQRWLSVRLDLIAAVTSFLINMLCISGVFSINAASAGLLIAYIMQIANLLSLMIRSVTQVQTNMNSVERLCEYAYDLPQEAAFEIPETKPPATWPTHGAMCFENVSMAYRPGLPLVLKNFSVSIKPGEKVGICGRTGAGKSSIMMALFRLTELHSGTISLDGIDISTIGLHDLRSKLSIIPQDPVLFRGTIRQNLDPFSECEDWQLWDALKRSWLVEARAETKLHAGEKREEHSHDSPASDHKFHLDQTVSDDGSNFSLGERQLLALARALVRNSKVLILDEATSSVDYETDAKIQSTIVDEFGHCTILCIAHRLKTILNYDRIIVLDKGEVMEFDTPLNLFQAGGSIFRQMCDKSGIVANDFVFSKKQ